MCLLVSLCLSSPLDQLQEGRGQVCLLSPRILAGGWSQGSMNIYIQWRKNPYNYEFLPCPCIDKETEAQRGAGASPRWLNED